MMLAQRLLFTQIFASLGWEVRGMAWKEKWSYRWSKANSQLSLKAGLRAAVLCKMGQTALFILSIPNRPVSEYWQVCKLWQGPRWHLVGHNAIVRAFLWWKLVTWEMEKENQNLTMQLRASSLHGWSLTPSDRRHTAPQVPRAASEPTYGQAVRHSSGKNRDENHLCLTNMTQHLWQATPVWGLCWGAGLPHTPGTPFLLPLSQSSPFPPDGPWRCSTPHCLQAQRGWQGEGSLGKVSGGGTLSNAWCIQLQHPKVLHLQLQRALGVQTPLCAPSAVGN